MGNELTLIGTAHCMHSTVNDIAAFFAFEGDFEEVVLYGSGHIHDTYALTYRLADETRRRYVMQRINTFVFHDPQAVMENIERVTTHLRSRILADGGDAARQTLTLIPTRCGACLHRSDDGEVWRAYDLIEGTHTEESAVDRRHVLQAAWAFGNFQRLLSDFPAGDLHETIPNFHHTPTRYAALHEAIGRDPLQRAAGVAQEIDFLLQRESDAAVLVDLLARGGLPLRVVHNDTKLNNVLFDDGTGAALCVIDLDTVMPGLSAYDFGDAVRAAAATAPEDETNLERVKIDLDTFNALAQGYLDAARAFLTRTEIDYLVFAARLITLEQAVRFLTDYLNGDVYYKIKRPAHNLERARTQMRLAQEMEAHRAEMDAIIQRYR